MIRPDYLVQGERARLFPVLATTSKEGRTTSVFLACLQLVDELGQDLLASIGQKRGKRASLEAFTEVVFKGEKTTANDRPDGLIVLKRGAKEWRALLEAKVGTASLEAEQIEKYRKLAKDHAVDCVITISNQFASTPSNHPIEEVRKSRSKIPVFHWSWMYIFTSIDLMLGSEGIRDEDQRVVLAELLRFLGHESAGLRGFERMPPEWSELNKLVSAGGKIPAKSDIAEAVVGAWHQETRDLSLILSRQTESRVQQKLSRKFLNDPVERTKSDLQILREECQLKASLEISDAASLLEIAADLPRRTIEVGMRLKAPEDRVSSKARVNWLLRQIKTENTGDVFVRLYWPGRSENTQFSYDELVADPSIVESGKSGLQVTSFHVFKARRLGGRFTQTVNFVTDLEAIVPEFYRDIGQNLVQWRKSPPKIRETSISEVADVVAEIEDGELE